MTALTSALGNLDYSGMLADIRQRIVESGQGINPAVGVNCRVTGVMPLVHEIQQCLNATCSRVSSRTSR